MTKIVAISASHRFSRVMMALVIGGIVINYAEAQTATQVNSTTNTIVQADSDNDEGAAIVTIAVGWTPSAIFNRSGTDIYGTLSASGLTTTNGINNGGDGITYAGDITGVGLLTASGLITSGSLTTGGISSTTISNSGNISTAALGVTGNASVGGTLGVTGAATLGGATQVNNTLGATGLITGTGGATITGTTSINATGMATTDIGNTNSTVNILGGTNTIGNAGDSYNNITGQTNTLEAHTNNIGVGTAGSINTIGNSSAATQVGMAGGNASASFANNAASMSVATAGGGSFLASTEYSTMRAGGNAGTTTGLATNGLTGRTAATGAGAVTVYDTVQTIGPDVTVSNSLNGKQYQTEVNGNLYVDGNVYINGTLDYVSSNSAATTVFGDSLGTSKLSSATQGTSGGTYIVMSGTNGATESMAAMTLTNGVGNTHGVEIYEDRTVLSGGTHSTTMTLDDHGAHFRNDATGGPARVTGVADGHSDFDAVNYRQMSRGVAMAAGLAAIPQVEPGKRFSMGAGTGLYHGQSAMAVGGSARVGSNTIVKGGLSFSLTKNDDPCANFGVSHSW